MKNISESLKISAEDQIDRLASFTGSKKPFELLQSLEIQNASFVVSGEAVLEQTVEEFQSTSQETNHFQDGVEARQILADHFYDDASNADWIEYHIGTGEKPEELNEQLVSHMETCAKCVGAGKVTCSTCSGGGDVSCGRCHATGKLPCGSCNNGKVRCTGCGGSGGGYRQGMNGQNQYQNCISCGGSGYSGMCWSCSGSSQITCDRCRGSGNVTCGSCHGSGRITCSNCSGNGEVIMQLTMKMDVSSARAVHGPEQQLAEKILKYPGADRQLYEAAKNEVAIKRKRNEPFKGSYQYSSRLTGCSAATVDGYKMALGHPEAEAEFNGTMLLASRDQLFKTLQKKDFYELQETGLGLVSLDCILTDDDAGTLIEKWDEDRQLGEKLKPMRDEIREAVRKGEWLWLIGYGILGFIIAFALNPVMMTSIFAALLDMSWRDARMWGRLTGVIIIIATPFVLSGRWETHIKRRRSTRSKAITGVDSAYSMPTRWRPALFVVSGQGAAFYTIVATGGSLW